MGFDRVMGTLSKLVRGCLLWAAVLMTPVAGTARVDCLCPDGHVKLFCLAVFAPSSACCGRDCCGTPRFAGQHGKETSCCGHGGRQRGAPGGGRIAGAPCKKVLAEAKLLAAPPASASVQDQVAAATPALAPPAVSPADPGSPLSVLSWHHRGLPPPTDLVIRLQHFVI